MLCAASYSQATDVSLSECLLERPLFQKKPKPVIASPPRAAAQPGASPWGEPWQPSSETSDVSDHSTRSILALRRVCIVYESGSSRLCGCCHLATCVPCGPLRLFSGAAVSCTFVRLCVCFLASIVWFVASTVSC